MEKVEHAAWKPAHLIRFIDYSFLQVVDLGEIAGHCQPECHRPIRYEVHVAPPGGGNEEIIGRVCYEHLLLLKTFGVETFKEMWEIDRKKTTRVGLYILRQKLEPDFEFNFAVLGERLEASDSRDEKKKILNSFYEELKRGWRAYRRSITSEEREQRNRLERDTSRSRQESERNQRRDGHVERNSEMIEKLSILLQDPGLTQWERMFVADARSQLTVQLWDLSPNQISKIREISGRVE